VTYNYLPLLAMIAGLGGLVAAFPAAKALKFAVQADGLGVGRNAPLGGAEEHGNVRGVDARNAGRNGIRFDGLVDGGKNDDLARDVYDDASAGEVRDDFIFAILRPNRKGDREEKKDKREPQVEGPVPSAPSTCPHSKSVQHPY